MKAHREIRTSKTRVRKFNGYCEECKKEICSCKAYQRLQIIVFTYANNVMRKDTMCI